MVCAMSSKSQGVGQLRWLAVVVVIESRLAMPDADVPASVDAAVGREACLSACGESEGDPNRGVGLTVSRVIRNHTCID